MTTYAQLQSDVLAFAAREDLSLVVPTFIRLAETEIYRRVRIMEMEARIDFAFSDPDYEDDMPTDFLGFARLSVTDSPNPKCQYVGPDVFASLAEMSPGNLAAIIGDAELLYTIEARKLRVNQPRGSATPIDINAVYFARPVALSVSDTDNPLFDQHYDLFLYGSLMQLWDYSDETEQTAKYTAKFDKTIMQIDDHERTRRRVAGSAVRTTSRMRGVV